MLMMVEGKVTIDVNALCANIHITITIYFRNMHEYLRVQDPRGEIVWILRAWIRSVLCM